MSRTSRFTIAIIIAVLVVVGVVVLIENNKNTPQPAITTKVSNLQTVTTVTYNGSNFVPAAISVNPGTTITFLNNSSVALQVSSADAGFNAGKSLTQGQSYSFTFKNKGMFNYSNVLDSMQAGKVTVL